MHAPLSGYVTPGFELGQTVRLGHPIGKVESLQDHYPGTTDHVHLEILAPGGPRECGGAD